MLSVAKITLKEAKIILKEAKNALNALKKLLFCVVFAQKHNQIAGGERLVRGDGLRGSNCVCKVPPPAPAEGLRS